ncbi:MAG: VTT domain-containing protein [Sneathiella sp.]
MKVPSEENKGAGVKKYLPLLLLAMVFASFFIFGLDDYLTFKALSDNRDRLLSFVENHYLVALGLYFILYTILVAASVPGGLLLTVSGGFLFGWIIGGTLAVFAATVGAALLFLIAATSLGAALHKKAGPWLTKLEDGFKDNAMSYLLFLRLVPAFPFWLVNIAPAFLGVPMRTYIIGTFFGIIPGTMVFASLGTGLDSIIVEQQDKFAKCQESGEIGCAMTFDVGSLVTKEIILSFVALGVISLLPILIKRLRKAQH